jgi:hypothetical protein
MSIPDGNFAAHHRFQIVYGAHQWVPGALTKKIEREKKE